MQMLLYVEEVHPLLGAFKAVIGQIPNPEGTVSQDEHLLGVKQTPQ